MNCCDEAGNCRQGRDCPVRLARMGMAVPDDDDTPSPEQRQRQELLDWLMWAVIVMLLTGALSAIGSFSAGYLFRFFSA